MQMKDMGFIMVGLLVLLPVVGLYLRRKAGDWGAKKGQEFAAKQAVKNLGSTLEGFGQPVLFEVSSVVALPVLEAAVGSKKSFVRGEGLEWTKLFLKEPWFKMALVDTPTGSELRIESFIESGGVHPGGPDWQLVKQMVLKQASKLGVVASVDAVTSTYARAEQVDERSIIWRRQ